MNITGLTKRASVYAFEDGVGELALGMAFAISGGAFLALHNLLAAGIWAGAFIAMAWAVKRLKERVIYPRGGYVALEEQIEAVRHRIPRQIWKMALCFAMMAVLAAANYFLVFPASQAVALTAIFSASYLFYGISYRMPSMLWIAACSALLGMAVYIRNDSRYNSIAFVLLWQGVALAASGGFRMWRFIKTHPRPAEAES